MNHSPVLVDTVTFTQRASRESKQSGPAPDTLPAFNCRWLYESSANRLGGVLGRTVQSRPGFDDPLLLLLLGLTEDDGHCLAAAHGSYGGWQALPRAFRRRVEKAFHPVRSEREWIRLVESFDRVATLRDRIQDVVPQAIEMRRKAAPADFPAPADAALDLELPSLDRGHRRRRTRILPNCAIETDHTGRIMVRPGDLPRNDYCLMYQTALVVAAGLLECKGGGALALTDDRVVPRDNVALTLAPLLTRYGTIPPNVPREWSHVRVAIGVEASASAAAAWFDCPKERTVDRYAAFAAISRHVQLSLRRWLPYLHYADSEFFADREAACAMLVYQSGKPYFRKGRPDCTYDPMLRSSVDLACRHARLRLPSTLETVYRHLQEAGLDSLAEHYMPRRATRILERVKCGNLRFLTLLGLDRMVMERFHRLANYCRSLRAERAESPAESRRFVFRGVHEVNRTFQSRLRRLSSIEDLSWLGTLTTVEATAVLATHMGLPTPIELTVRLSNASGQPGRQPLIVRSSLLP